MTFVLTLPDFGLQVMRKKGTFLHANSGTKTMKTKTLERSLSPSCAVSSVVEHFLDTEGVRGSNPLSRTIPAKVGQESRLPSERAGASASFDFPPASPPAREACDCWTLYQYLSKSSKLAKIF